MISKIGKLFHDREFWKYVGEFFGMMVVIYVFSLLTAGMAAPGFTYAAF